jgi:hypothetical protein
LSSLPAGRLQGSGKIGRYRVVHDDAVLDDPEVRASMDDAVAFADAQFDGLRERKLPIRGVSEKQRARRPAKRAAKC